MKPIDEILTMIKDEVKTIDNNLNDYLSDEKISFTIKELVKNYIDEIIRQNSQKIINREIHDIVFNEIDIIFKSKYIKSLINHEIKKFIYSNDFSKSIIKSFEKTIK